MTPSDAATSQQSLYRRNTSLVLLATGVVFLLGTLVDLGILWFLQRGPTVQADFVATTQTVEGLPRVILALALVYLSGHVGRWSALSLYRALALGVLLVGLAGIPLLLQLVTSYSLLASSVSVDALPALRATTFKSAALAVIYIVALLPLGMLGFRDPR